MSLIRGLPRAKNSPTISKADIETARINNQFAIKGTNPTFPGALTEVGQVIFLEYVQASTTIVVSDNEGTALTGACVSPLDLSHDPIRIDGSMTITGTVLLAKGFIVSKGNLEI